MAAKPKPLPPTSPRRTARNKVLAAEVRNRVGGKLDILVSNAGISSADTIENFFLSVKEFDNLFAVNVRAPYFLACSSC